MARELDILKRRLRVEARQRRASMSVLERRERSHLAHRVLTASPEWQDAEAVGLFCSMKDEIDTRALRAAAWGSGKRVALPFTPPLGHPLEFRWVTAHDSLIQSEYGVDEPGPQAPVADVADLDLLIVPGLAFDTRGARLGYGGGYYDRTLGADVRSVMLAFACQEVEVVPRGPHDQRVHAVVTENGWLATA